MANHPNRGPKAKPSPGRIVMYRQGDHERLQAVHDGTQGQFPDGPSHRGTNGTRHHPAIITRVWGNDENCAVNLLVFFDGFGAAPRSSVMPLAELPDDVQDVSGNSGWYWPARV